MSIILSYRRHGQVAILSDGAILNNAEGTLAKIGRKVTTSAKYPVAVAARGDADWAKTVSGLIVGWVEDQGFDKAMAMLADLMPKFAPKALPHDLVEVLIAGVSETEGSTHRVFFNVANGGHKALELVDPGPTCWLAVDTDTAETFETIGVRAPQPEELPGMYFAKTGVQYMNYYRRFVGRETAGSGRRHTADYKFGGQVDLTTVDPTGVFTRTIHHWPDKIGEKINPFAHIPNVTPIGNRRARRAARKLA